MSRSHLKNHLQKQAFKNIAFALLGIIVLIFVLFQFGPQLLINFSLMVDKLKGDKEVSSSNQDLSFVSPPMLGTMPSATNSAIIIVSGYSLPKQTIKLYVNGDFVDKKETKEDKGFTFEEVELKSGDNDIKVKAVTEDNKESDYSSIIKIRYVNKLPSLDIDSPSDGQSFSKDQNQIKADVLEFVEKTYEEKEKQVSPDIMRQIEKTLLLRVIDELWVDHLEQMEYLRDSVRLRAYGQRDPLIEYKIEGQKLFIELQSAIGSQVANLIFKIGPVNQQISPVVHKPAKIEYNKTETPNPNPDDTVGAPTLRRGSKTPGRNDPCFCGSGKKYKKCHGV